MNKCREAGKKRKETCTKSTERGSARTDDMEEDSDLGEVLMAASKDQGVSVIPTAGGLIIFLPIEPLRRYVTEASADQCPTNQS